MTAKPWLLCSTCPAPVALKLDTWHPKGPSNKEMSLQCVCGDTSVILAVVSPPRHCIGSAASNFRAVGHQMHRTQKPLLHRKSIPFTKHRGTRTSRTTSGRSSRLPGGTSSCMSVSKNATMQVARCLFRAESAVVAVVEQSTTTFLI
jgi:hypothetical protein